MSEKEKKGTIRKAIDESLRTHKLISTEIPQTFKPKSKKEQKT